MMTLGCYSPGGADPVSGPCPAWAASVQSQAEQGDQGDRKCSPSTDSPGPLYQVTPEPACWPGRRPRAAQAAANRAFEASEDPLWKAFPCSLLESTSLGK